MREKEYNLGIARTQFLGLAKVFEEKDPVYSQILSYIGMNLPSEKDSAFRYMASVGVSLTMLEKSLGVASKNYKKEFGRGLDAEVSKFVKDLSVGWFCNWGFTGKDLSRACFEKLGKNRE